MKHSYQVIPDDNHQYLSHQSHLEVEGVRKHDNSKSLSKSTFICFIATFVILALVAIVFMVRTQDTRLFDVYTPSNRFLYLASAKYGQYLVANSKTQTVLFSSPYPLLHSSSITIDTLSNNCHSMHASDGSIIAFHVVHGFQYGIDTDDPLQHELFTFVKSPSYDNDNSILIKICNRPIWISLSINDDVETFTAAYIEPTYYNAFKAVVFGYHVNISTYLPPNAGFNLISQPYYRGVNLGGWFIPEVWMRRSFFNGTGLGWGGSLCGMVKYSRVQTEIRMMESLDTWITEKDFQHIATAGFDSVRLPIGYWNIIDDPYTSYAPANTSVSIKYIDLAYEWASKYGLKVLLDLHGLPGSQNGIDHSGCAMKPYWLEDSDNIMLTLQAIEALALRYANHPQTIGIEIANEPGNHYSTCNHSELVVLYQQAYHVIRKVHPTVFIVFNELYDIAYDLWKDALQEPEYSNVVMDLHLYDWQEPFTSHSKAEHVQDAEKWVDVISSQRLHHPILIGEWSMSTGTFVQAGQPYVNAAVTSFRNGGSLGWFLWNWKIEDGLGFDEWDASLQAHQQHGLNPLI